MTNKEYWESLNPVEYDAKYKEFMYNIDNMNKCTECPHGDDGYSGPGISLCGQYHCWVLAHCRTLQDDE